MLLFKGFRHFMQKVTSSTNISIFPLFLLNHFFFSILILSLPLNHDRGELILVFIDRLPGNLLWAEATPSLMIKLTFNGWMLSRKWDPQDTNYTASPTKWVLENERRLVFSFVMNEPTNTLICWVYTFFIFFTSR